MPLLVPQMHSHPRPIKTPGRSPIHAADSPLARAMAINRHLESLRSIFLSLICASRLAPYCIGMVGARVVLGFPMCEVARKESHNIGTNKLA